LLFRYVCLLSAWFCSPDPVTVLSTPATKHRRPSAAGTTARKRSGALPRFLDWCQDEGRRRPQAPQPRTHYLTLPKLALLWDAGGGFREPVWRDFRSVPDLDPLPTQ